MQHLQIPSLANLQQEMTAAMGKSGHYDEQQMYGQQPQYQGYNMQEQINAAMGKAGLLVPSEKPDHKPEHHGGFNWQNNGVIADNHFAGPVINNNINKGYIQNGNVMVHNQQQFVNVHPVPPKPKPAPATSYGISPEPVEDLHSAFMQHISTFGLSYATIEEFNFRKNLFIETDRELKALRASDPNMTYTVGHNMFSTMTASEKTMLFGYDGMDAPSEPTILEESVSNGGVDHRRCQNAIQDQQHCGSCWAFAATAAIEGSHCLAGHGLVKLSEEQIVQCSSGAGCSGGNPTAAMNHCKRGQNTERNYPYTSGRGQTGHCDKQKDTGSVKVQSVHSVRRNDPNQLKAALNRNVVTVVVGAENPTFMHYNGGIINSGCNTRTDHAIAAVGYGSQGGKEYYIVRNSWGTNWGEKGYAKIAITSGEGTCKIQSGPAYPTTN